MLSKNNIQNFVNYNNYRATFSKKYACITGYEVRKAIDVYNETGMIQIPRMHKVAKADSKKKRTVFVFDDADKLLLRYVNNLISRYDLEVSANCVSFQQNKDFIRLMKIIKTDSLHDLYCMKLDITDYYNSINVDKLIASLPYSLTNDTAILNLLTKVLCTEDVKYADMIIQVKQKGVMAGTPIASNLSNIYLNEFDKLMTSLSENYVRYADDMLIFCKSESELKQLQEIVYSELNKYNLTLNTNKTQFSKPNEGFEFLGFKIFRGRTELSAGNVTKVKGKIRRSCKSARRYGIKKGYNPELAVIKVIRKFNRKWFGINAREGDFTWAKHFFPRLTTDKELKLIDQYFQEHLRYAFTGSYSKKNYKELPYKKLKELGYMSLVAEFWKFKREHAVIN